MLVSFVTWDITVPESAILAKHDQSAPKMI